jgi:hypothetical protein
MPSTKQVQVQVRTKKRHSKRVAASSGRRGCDDIGEERSVHDLVDTVSEVPENVARTKKLEAEKLMPSKPKELVARQTKGSEDVLKRITTVEEVVHQKLDKLAAAHDELVRQFQRRVEEDGVVISAQKDIIEQLEEFKQEAGALVTTLRQVVGSSSTPAVSATVEAVEKDVGNWGSVLAASSVQAASKSKIGSKDELKPRKKEKPEKVMATKVETVKVDDPGKVVATKVETEVEAPLFFLQWAKPLILTQGCGHAIPADRKCNHFPIPIAARPQAYVYTPVEEQLR